MKIIAFNASPKGIRGNTQKILTSLVNAAKDAGAQSELVLLKNQRIEDCTGCLTCWFKSPGKCVWSDDVNHLRDKLFQADYIIMASPVYLFSISSQLKRFLERLLFPLSKPEIQIVDGKLCHPTVIKGKPLKFLLLTTGAFDDTDDIEYMEQHFRRIIHSTVTPEGDIYADCQGVICIHPFTLLADSEVLDKSKVLFDTINLLGKKIAETGHADKALISEINRPIYQYTGMSRQTAIVKNNEILLAIKQQFESTRNKYVP